MQLIEFKATHFRSLYDAGPIPFHDLTVLIGENDGGKTATLDAIAILLSSRVPDPEDFSFVPGSKQEGEESIARETEIVLEGWFSMSGEERLEVAKHAPVENDRLHICKRFAQDEEMQHWAIGPVPDDPRLQVDLDSMKIQSLRDLAAELDLPVGGTKLLPFIEAIREYRDRQPTNVGQTPFPQAIERLLPEFTKFDSASDPQAVIHGVLRTVFREEIEKPSNALRLKEVEKDITSSLQSTAAALTPYIQKYRPEVKSVDVDPEFNFESGFKATHLRLLDRADRPILLEKRGTGIRKHITLAVYEWNSEVLKKRQEEGARPLILALDEPDTSLDYQSQRKLFDIIQQFRSPLVQVVICTHSVNLINRVPVQQLNHYLLTDNHTKSMIETFKPDPTDQKEVDFFLHRLGDSMGLNNALMFYERCFLIFEGKTEEAAMPILFKLCVGDFPYTMGIRIVNAYDNYGAIVFAKFLHNHNRKVVFAVDEDTTRNKGVARHLKTSSLAKAGFDIATQVHFIGLDHFEFSFTDEVWAKALKLATGSSEWTPEEVNTLREPAQSFVSKLMSKSGIQDKPSLGVLLAKSLDDPAQVPEPIRLCFEQAVRLALQ